LLIGGCDVPSSPSCSCMDWTVFLSFPHIWHILDRLRDSLTTRVQLITRLPICSITVFYTLPVPSVKTFTVISPTQRTLSPNSHRIHFKGSDAK
jgi:hypothetical protein